MGTVLLIVETLLPPGGEINSNLCVPSLFFCVVDKTRKSHECGGIHQLKPPQTLLTTRLERYTLHSWYQVPVTPCMCSELIVLAGAAGDVFVVILVVP